MNEQLTAGKKPVPSAPAPSELSEFLDTFEPDRPYWPEDEDEEEDDLVKALGGDV